MIKKRKDLRTFSRKMLSFDEKIAAVHLPFLLDWSISLTCLLILAVLLHVVWKCQLLNMFFSTTK